MPVEVLVLWKGDLLSWGQGSEEAIRVAGLSRGELEAAIARSPDDGSWAETELGALVVRTRRGSAAGYRDVTPALDRGLAWSMTAAMTLGIAFLLAVGFVPPAGAAVTVEALTADHPLLAYVDAPDADEPVPRQPLPIDGSGPIAEGPGQPMREDAGVSGHADGPRSRRGRIRFRGEREVTRRIPRAADPRAAGILGVLSSLDDIARTGALAGAEDVEGWTRDEAYGRPLAELVGMGHGTDGFDMVGTGRGGCMPGDDNCGDGTVGVGPGVGWGGTGWGSTCDDTCDALFGMGVTGGIINLRGREDARRGRRRHRRGSSVPSAIRRVVVHRDEGLTRDQIRRAMRRHHDALRHCYERAYAAAGGQDGLVEIGLAIDPDGHVLSSEVVGDTLGDGEVAACIAGVARRARFPTADAATVATIPFGLDVFGGPST